MKKILFILIAFLAITIGIYPIVYFISDVKVGLISTKSDSLLAFQPWQIAFKGHILFGGMALLTGWAQFNKKWRNKYLQFHRRLGIFYMSCVLVSGLCAFYLSFNTTGIWLNGLGFGLLAVVWLSTTTMAFVRIKQKNIEAHKIFMIYSYAACLAAVSLRILLPILQISLGGFDLAYSMVAWLCWVPNLLIAHFIVTRQGMIYNSI